MNFNSNDNSNQVKFKSLNLEKDEMLYEKKAS